jgi:putative ABC transport system substrate-binding protein
VGYLSPGLPDDGPLLQAFLEGMRLHGQVEGRTFSIENLSAQGRFEMLPVLADQLVKLNVDVIVAPTTSVARAAKDATHSIPIVFTIVSDPIGSGLVSNLSHPDGNVTGLSDMDVDLAGKRLDLLKQVLPNLRRVGALGYAGDKVWQPWWREAQEAAQRLGIEIVPILIPSADQLDKTFAQFDRRIEALLVAPQIFFGVRRKRVLELISSRKLPSIHERKALPVAGALMSYGPNYVALLNKTAGHVDKIMRGARPSQLPVEQPTEYELVINLKTAKALGITIPESILLRADEVIR